MLSNDLDCQFDDVALHPPFQNLGQLRNHSCQTAHSSEDDLLLWRVCGYSNVKDLVQMIKNVVQHTILESGMAFLRES